MASLSAGELDVLVTIALILAQQIVIVRKFPTYAWDQQLGPAGFVFIDEIDAHLHPEWQERIVPLLLELFPHVLFVLTTHSPFILRSLSPQTSVILRLPDGARFETDFTAWQTEDILKVVFEVSGDWNADLKDKLARFETLVADPEQLPAALEQYRELMSHESHGLRAECRKIIALYASRAFQEAVADEAAIHPE